MRSNRLLLPGHLSRYRYRDVRPRTAVFEDERGLDGGEDEFCEHAVVAHLGGGVAILYMDDFKKR